ncbi:hypothetical protein [Nocardia sp. alder85J]|uniref:hypothetical protein n=1 Tax=Nocardia sp. alder85J TaxID=2862949 RepID=UPI001CD7E852|nr:hypothetical protein [Nocardia sp. alder85J]MCX4095017.1 hypothetical protein [Nocardia sp. alder85J]
MTARRELEEALHGPVSALDFLTESESADLLRLFEGARRHEVTALSEAVDRMVHALPWPLGPTTKRIMFGHALDR